MWLLALSFVIALVVLWRVIEAAASRRPASSTRSLEPHRSPPRRSRTKASRRSRSEAPPPVALPRRRPRDPGWVYLEWDLNVRCYWDGKRWTERQEWNVDDRGWVTTRLAPLEPSTA